MAAACVNFRFLSSPHVKPDSGEILWKILYTPDEMPANMAHSWPPAPCPSVNFPKTKLNAKGCSGGEERALRLHPWLNKPGLGG